MRFFKQIYRRFSNMSFIHKLAIQVKRYNLIPQSLQRFIQTHTNMLDIRTTIWVAKDPFAKDPPASSYEPRYPFTLGIIKEFWHLHYKYIAACREMGVAYKVLDISGPDWLKIIEKSNCDAFLVCPSVEVSVWKQMYDERLRVMVHDMGKILFPSYDEIWFYESKRRMHYWLQAHGVLHPKTWVFYDIEEALAFADQAELPIVYKSDLGSGATGVKIFRERDALRRHIRRCFNRGFTTYRRCPNDKEWGFVILQEYLPDVREWRMIRIGNSYFGHEKGRQGDFHSGSHIMIYSRPQESLLNYVREVTNKGGFMSLDLDIFDLKDGKYMINEMQCQFGMDVPSEPQCMIDGKEGRMIWNSEYNCWNFEEGIFCQNYLCNLRVQTLLEILERKLAMMEKKC